MLSSASSPTYIDLNDTPLLTRNESERTSLVTTLMFRGNIRNASKSLTYVLHSLESFVLPGRPPASRRRTLEEREITSVPERMDEVLRRLSPFVVLENVGRGATGFKRPTLLWGKRSRTHAIRILVDAVIRRAKQTGAPLRNALLAEILDVLQNKDCNSTKRYNFLLLEVKANRMYVQMTGSGDPDSSASSASKDMDEFSMEGDSFDDDTSFDQNNLDFSDDFDLDLFEEDLPSDFQDDDSHSHSHSHSLEDDSADTDHSDTFEEDSEDFDLLEEHALDSDDDDSLNRDEIQPLRELLEDEEITEQERDDLDLFSRDSSSSDSLVVYRYE